MSTIKILFIFLSFFVALLLWVSSLFILFNLDKYFTIYAIGIKNASFCRLIVSGGDRDACYGIIAEASANPTSCNLITDRTFMEICSNSVYAKLAEKERNYSLCEKSSNPSDRDDCIRVVAVVSNNYSICESITTSELTKEDCKKGIGIRGLDIDDTNRCEIQKNKIVMGICYYDVLYQKYTYRLE